VKYNGCRGSRDDNLRGYRDDNLRGYRALSILWMRRRQKKGTHHTVYVDSCYP
jgi:hypothetical protein